MNFEQSRIKMVDNQVRPCDVTNHALLTAMLSVPREAFFSEDTQALAYLDRDSAIDGSQENNARYRMSPGNLAKLIQLCDTQSDDVVLLIGAGSGYTAGVFSHLASSVVAIEEETSLVQPAADVITELGYDNVVMLEGNHKDGWEREAPYDVIFVDGSVEIIPDAWQAQLAQGGRLVVVVGSGNSARAVIYTKREGHVGHVAEFNCSVPALPGFEKTTGFAL